ncbi:autophagy-related protein 13-domain-containing protein [Auriculariales sp. MPI-PUGE-AT-0066]|nr:autophagy-related protein 13-domain-containing protein [Auriculariales sp. MPI-PUGE-AT-0066]
MSYSSLPSDGANAGNDTARVDQIAHKLFHKFALVLADARVSTPPAPTPKLKLDRWFNLEATESDTFRGATNPFRAVTTIDHRLAFELVVILAVPDQLANGDVVVLNGVPVQPTPRGLVVERWSLVFDPHTGNDKLELPIVYKQGISLFRSLYTLVRILPAWKLYKRAARRRGGIQLYVHVGELEHGILDFDTPLSRTAPPSTTAEQAFPAVSHPAGSITLSVRYMPVVEFTIVPRENLLSNELMQQEQATQQQQPQPEFTPTVRRHVHGSGGSSSPGSQPLVSRPNAPPQPIRPASAMAPRNDLDRFIVPVERPQSAVAFPSSPIVAQSQSSQPRQGTFPFPSPTNVSPKIRELVLEDREYGPLGASYRGRRDSGTGSLGLGGMSTVVAGAMPVLSSANRRSSTSSPFKSATLSGSLAGSLRTAGLTGGGAITSSNMGTITNSNMVTVTGGRPSPSTHRPLSSIFTAPPPGSVLTGSPSSLGQPLSPIAAAAAVGRPSPPQPSGIAPGSLDRRSDPSSSIQTGTSGGSGHKRYSSTFGNRYSAGPSTPAPGQQQQRDAELQHFVSALDSHEPLRRAREVSESDVTGERALLGGAIPTAAGDVKSELQRMHDEFAASLEGLERMRVNSNSTPPPMGTGGGYPDPFRTRRDSAEAPPSPTSSPLVRRRPDSPLSSPILARGASSNSPGSSPLVRQATVVALPTRPSALNRQPSASGPGAVRQPDSPLARHASPAQGYRDSGSGHSSPAGDRIPGSPYRDSDDERDRDRGAGLLRRGSWRPRPSGGGGGGTDSEGERGGAGGSASDLVVGRMDL